MIAQGSRVKPDRTRFIVKINLFISAYANVARALLFAGVTIDISSLAPTSAPIDAGRWKKLGRRRFRHIRHR